MGDCLSRASCIRHGRQAQEEPRRMSGCVFRAFDLFSCCFVLLRVISYFLQIFENWNHENTQKYTNCKNPSAYAGGSDSYGSSGCFPFFPVRSSPSLVSQRWFSMVGLRNSLIPMVLR